jgi:myo-inositol 2-dehydrogenase/D-chiro-inositol 1-dehydrogenase
MPIASVNRRHFLGCSAAAGLALAQGRPDALADRPPLRVGFVGLGGRGTALLRAALAMPGVRVVGLCDPDPRHRLRAQGIAEKAQRQRPDATPSLADLLGRGDLDAVCAAVPCDRHAEIYVDVLRAGKHLYAEKPLALTVADCDRVIAEARRRPELVVHTGFQRRHHPRNRAAVEFLRAGGIGPLAGAFATWFSSNGPVVGHGGWLGRRERSGDWMLEQAVHVWDLLAWVGGRPEQAIGSGQRDLFRERCPERDVTDWYQAHLVGPGGFSASMEHCWIMPAEKATGLSITFLGGEGTLDLRTGVATFRDRERPRHVLPAGTATDTELALAAFFRAARADQPEPPAGTLEDARRATQIGLLVRQAVDERRAVTWDELFGPA